MVKRVMSKKTCFSEIALGTIEFGILFQIGKFNASPFNADTKKL